MDRDNLCSEIIEKNYIGIFHYCMLRLGNDIYGAEECTQDVFLLLWEKKNHLDLDENIRGWLYAAADRVIKDFQRRKLTSLEIMTDNFDVISDISVDLTLDDKMPVYDVLDALTEEEYTLLRKYYSIEHGTRNELAKELGISLNALYQRIHNIKNKLGRR